MFNVRAAKFTVLPLLIGVAVSGVVRADASQDNQALKEQMRVMMQQMQALQKQVDRLSNGSPQAQMGPPSDAAPTVAAAAVDKEPLLHEILKGFYGNLDVSVDETSKGIKQLPPAYPYSPVNPANPNSPSVISGGPKASPVGQVGYQVQEGTNKALLGYRGAHDIAGSGVEFLYQIETQPSITSAPGLNTSYTQQSNDIKAGIGFGDTFIGIGAGKDAYDWGRFKFGTTYAPYKRSTDRMNPFSGELGDYAVLMGNTGGDNRVEFGSRLEHSMWYESPKLLHDMFSFDVLFSPGQNRTYDNVIQASGSSDCTGGNSPGSGNLPLNCDDGSFGTAWSADIKFEVGGLYATAAYELHKAVNRNSDGIGANAPQYAYAMGLGNGVSPLLDWNDYNNYVAEYGQNYINANGFTPEYTSDIGTERAFKTGVQYVFDFGLSVSTIYEYLWRDIPADLEWLNERQRNGWWFALSQTIGRADNVSLGYGHAGATVGDPSGQHNYNPNSLNDSARLYSFAWKHRFDKHFSAYFDAAKTVNYGNAHYDLGAGGRGLTTDCHDGTNTTVIDYSSAGNTTWGGCKPVGMSLGMDYKF